MDVAIALAATVAIDRDLKVFQRFITVNTIFEHCVYPTANASQTFKLNLEEDTAIGFEIHLREQYFILAIKPAPEHQTGPPATIVVFEASKGF
jgi:hypothetical protein